MLGSWTSWWLFYYSCKQLLQWFQLCLTLWGCLTKHTTKTANSLSRKWRKWQKVRSQRWHLMSLNAYYILQSRVAMSNDLVFNTNFLNSQMKKIMYNRAWQRNPIREKSNWCDGKISLVFAKNVHLAGWLNLTCKYRILMICCRLLGWTCPSVRWVSRAYFPFSVYWTSSCNWFWYCISVSSVYIIIYHELPFLLEQIWSRQYNPCSLVCNL